MCVADPDRAYGGIAVKNAAHLYNRAGELDLFAEDFCAIGRGENGFADIQTHFAAVDIERGHNFDIARAGIGRSADASIRHWRR